MKALYQESEQARDMSVRTVPYDSLKLEPNEVVIKVKYAGICGTDLKMYQGKYKGFSPPVVLGHEFSGEIVEIGEAVKGLRKGQQVVAEPSASNCEGCHVCLEGKTNLCLKKKRYGFDVNGAFAEYIKVQESQVHILPKDIGMKEAAMIEPLAVVVHGINEITIKPTDVVLVIGPGTIGLMALLLSKANGATVIVAGLSKDQSKLDLAQELGADFLFVADKDAEDKIMDLTNGKGADIVLECSGSAAGVNQGIRLCKRSGEFVQIGTWSHPITIDYMKIAYKEITLHGSYGHTKQDWVETISLIHNKKVELSSLIESTFPLEEWKEAFEAAEGGALPKVLFEMHSH